MTPPLKKTFLFWGGVFCLCLLLVWLLGDILLPFVTGFIVAYILNPVVERLNRRGLNRKWATLFILSIFLVFLSAGAAIVLPLILQEGTVLIERLPALIAQAENVIVDYFPTFGPIVTAFHLDDLPDIAQKYGPQIFNMSSIVATGVANSGAVAFSVLAFLALMPVVAFYMMLEWPRIVSDIRMLFPRSQVKILETLFLDMDRRLSGFIRGQILVCLILAVYYAIGLSAVGLDHGVLIGLLSGLFSLIPFVGSAIGLGVGVLVAIFQMSSAGWIVLVLTLGVFGLGQFIEGNFITPRIVGKSVGLHPLWIIFALFAGGILLGIVGMLIAVPVAAMIAVLIEFSITRYKNSTFYKS